MADKLGLGSEVKELHLGTSFTNPRGSAFHTFRYDFKPASVDTTKMATVDVLPNNEVNVTVPHCDGAGGAQTSIFRGPKKPYTKECVLIIDHNTGEITLERLSHNIQLKKTRMESVSKPNSSFSPSDSAPQGPTTHSKRPSPAQKSPPAVSFSPPMPTPFSNSPTRAKASPKNAHIKKRAAGCVETQSFSTPALQPGSMPILDDLDAPLPMPIEQRDTAVGVLSDSSSDSDSESSSGSSGSDSDSEEIEDRPNKIGNLDVVTGTESVPASNSTSHLSMPSHLLSEDLQLSDSGSDSD